MPLARLHEPKRRRSSSERRTVRNKQQLRRSPVDDVVGGHCDPRALGGRLRCLGHGMMLRGPGPVGSAHAACPPAHMRRPCEPALTSAPSLGVTLGHARRSCQELQATTRAQLLDHTAHAAPTSTASLGVTSLKPRVMPPTPPPLSRAAMERSQPCCHTVSPARPRWGSH